MDAHLYRLFTMPDVNIAVKRKLDNVVKDEGLPDATGLVRIL